MRRRCSSLRTAPAVLLLLLVLAVPVRAGAAAFWSQPESIISGFPGIVAYDLAVDVSGVVHVVFSQGTGSVYYLNNSSGTWRRPEPVAYSQVGYAVQDVKLLATEDGSLQLFYIEAKEGDYQLKHMRSRGTSWALESLAGYSSSISCLGAWADAAGFLHCLVQGTAAGAQDYKGRFGLWERLELGAYDATSAFAVDQFGAHHVVRARDNAGRTDIVYSCDLTGDWVDTKLATLDGPAQPRLLVDKDLHVHAAWCDAQRSSHIFLTSNAADGATFAAPRDITAGSSLAFNANFGMVSDAGGNVVLAVPGLGGPEGNSLYCLTDESGRWSSPQLMKAGFSGARRPALASRYLATYAIYERPEAEGLSYLFGPPAGSTAPGLVNGGHCVIGAAQAATEWYFAEGFTGSGFNCWLTIANTTDVSGSVEFSYILEDEVRQVYHTVKAHARTTIDLMREIGPDKNVSVRLRSPMPITVERPMYFAYPVPGGGTWDGGHCVMGVSRPATDWYFAEGTTRAGFDEYLTVQNPDPVRQARITCEYMRAKGGSILREYLVAPSTRATVYVNAEVPGEDVSMHVASDVDVICERPLYFSYGGAWTGGHCVAGANAPRNDWYFAEGTTRAGFDEWLCIQNPGDVPAEVDFQFMLDAGEVINHRMNVPERSRRTLHVPDVVEAGRDVSVAVTCLAAPIVVERPIYFGLPAPDGGPPWTGGHDVMGGQPGMSFLFAEGCTRAGFQEYLCLQNPGPEGAQVTVEYIPSGGAATSDSYTLAPHSRTTLWVNPLAGPDKDLSLRVESDRDILAERPLYFSYNLQ